MLTTDMATHASSKPTDYATYEAVSTDPQTQSVTRLLMERLHTPEAVIHYLHQLDGYDRITGLDTELCVIEK